jgi:(2Fe-2S) ferredoxin
MDLTDLLEIADKEKQARPPVQIRCCTAAGCVSAGSEAVLERLKQAVADAGLEDRVAVSGVGCLRLCARGPLVAVDPEDALYQQVTAESASSIVAGVQGGQVTAGRIDADDPFFALQSSVVLENSGKIDPERIESYIAADGYQSLGKVVRDMTPEQVIETIAHSGLRGRGGAGYPAGLKWATVAKNSGQEKYRRVQRRRGRSRRVHEPERHGERPASSVGGHGHRGLRRGRQAGLHLRPGRVSAGHRAAAEGDQASRPTRTAGHRGFLHAVRVSHRPPHRRRGVCMRRGDIADGLDHGHSRRPDAPPALPRRERAVGNAHADQQRGNVRQCAGDHPRGAGVVCRPSAHREMPEPRCSASRARS